MKNREEFVEYARKVGMSYVNTCMMLNGVEREFKGIEHLIGGFCGLKWDKEKKEWVEKYAEKHN
jgi:hypothetical protein